MMLPLLQIFCCRIKGEKLDMKPMKIQNDKSRYLALGIVPSYSQHWGFIPG